jgi:precorrin-2/cobalt-factor-2 C20-methyltransferase
VLRLLREMGIAEHCVFGNHVGMPDERIYVPVDQINAEEAGGYLSTMLIRKSAPPESLKSKTGCR